MPYIKQEDRPKFDKILSPIYYKIATKKELAYCIFRLMRVYGGGDIIRYEDVPDYFNTENKKLFDDILDQLPKIESKGELEYCIYKLMVIYMQDKEYRYSILHDVVYSVIDCGNEFMAIYKLFDKVRLERVKETAYACIHAGHEFQRRHLDKREDKAIEENGDVI